MSDLTSMFMYIVLFSFASILLFLSQVLKKNKKNGSYLFFVFFGLIIPLLISGLRYNVGTDFLNYVNQYYRTIQISYLDYLQSIEIELGFFSILKFSTLFGSEQIVFLLSAFITLVFIYLAISKHDNKIPLALCFIIYLFIFFPLSFNIIRQSIAVAIVLYSYRYIHEKNFKKFFLYCLIASTFHITAFFIIPFYFLFHNNDETKTLKERRAALYRGIAIVVSMIFVLNFNVFFESLSNLSGFEKFGKYSEEMDLGNNREIYLSGLIVVVVLLFRKKLIAYDSRNKMYIFFLIIGLILTFAGFYNPFVKRIAIYFNITQVFLLAYLATMLKDKLDRYLATCTVVLYSIGYFILVYYVLRQGDVIPYQTSFIP